MLKRWRLLSLLALVPLLLSGCGKPFLSTLKPAGEVADKQYDLTVLSTLIMVVVVAVVAVIFFYVIVRFRRSRVGKTRYRNRWRGTVFRNHLDRYSDLASDYSCHSGCHRHIGAGGYVADG